MLNMDFTRPVSIETLKQDWAPSPMPGVWRKPLAREEAERGHATSIVSYEAGAAFSPHGHPKGEEILVLEGVFSDQSGDYSAGTYFRNPEGFSHAPFSKGGCVILVKLHQFQPDDSAHITVQTDQESWDEVSSGLERLVLHQHNSEQACMYRSSKPVVVSLPSDGGLEVFIISGSLQENNNEMAAGTWLRRPVSEADYHLAANSLIWVKSGHLDT